MFARLPAQDFGGQPANGSIVERTERDDGRPVPLELIDRRGGIGRRFRRRTPGDQPRDRRAGEGAGQGPERGDRAVVRPLRVIDDDHQRSRRGGPFEQDLKVPKQPEPLAGFCPDRWERTPVDERLGPIEQRTEQRRELDSSLSWLCHRDAEADPPPLRVPDAFEEEPALADPAHPLDDDDATRTRGDLIEQPADQPKLSFAALDPCLMRPGRRRPTGTDVGSLVPWSRLSRHSTDRAYRGSASASDEWRVRAMRGALAQGQTRRT